MWQCPNLTIHNLVSFIYPIYDMVSQHVHCTTCLDNNIHYEKKGLDKNTTNDISSTTKWSMTFTSLDICNDVKAYTTIYLHAHIHGCNDVKAYVYRTTRTHTTVITMNDNQCYQWIFPVFTISIYTQYHSICTLWWSGNANYTYRCKVFEGWCVS